MQRAGNAHLNLNRLDEALEYFKKSKMEDRNSKTLELLKKTEKAIEERKKKEYFDPALSTKAKEEGNEFFKIQKYPEAIKCYDEAIKRDPENHINYSNRASCYIKVLALPDAMKDAEKCIALKPDFVKGYIRKAQTHFLMKEYQKCLETYQTGLELDPNNAEITTGIQKCVEQMNKGMDGETVKRNVERDPELQQILTDPIIQQVLSDLKENPAAAQNYLKDPEIRRKIEKLISSGILSVKSQ